MLTRTGQPEEPMEHGGKRSLPPPPPGVKLLRTLSTPQNAVRCVAFDRHGWRLASGNNDSTVKLWEVRSGKLLQSLEGHSGTIYGVAFDPQSRIVASGSSDRTLKVWDARSGTLLRTLEGHQQRVRALAFDQQSGMLASGSFDQTAKIWDPHTGQLVRTLKGHEAGLLSVSFDPVGARLATAGRDNTIRLWDVQTGEVLCVLEGHQDWVASVAFDPHGLLLASGSDDQTVKLWDAHSGKLLRTLERHTGRIDVVAFSHDGRLFASKGGDHTIRLWSCETWENVASIPEPTHPDWWIPALSFHPSLPLLVAAGSKEIRTLERCRLVHLWELDFDVLLRQEVEPSAHYVNAKVVLVGDTGVGKSGLSLVLCNLPYGETDSTAGRCVSILSSTKASIGNGAQTRETLLWDLAGQPGYRIIHQLHLGEVAVAVVVFDSRSEVDPLAGVRHWERALRLAQQRQGASGVPMKRFLVSARNDRGGVAIGEERIRAILDEFGFDRYFKTSAKESWQINELRSAIEEAIAWDKLPVVSSSKLFVDIKAFLLDVKKSGRLLAPAPELYEEFARKYSDGAVNVADLRAQFETCIGRLENRDLIRRVTFGGYVLLQPELLDAYASAIVNAAKDEPDGLGSLAEEVALTGKFYVPGEQKITDLGQEQLLLHATIEELVRHDLALRENSDDGRYLVFPSQFSRDYEDAPEPKGKAVTLTFDGPVQSIYSTLAVRLGHSGLFSIGRTEMWRNAAVFDARAGGKCGLFLQEFSEGRGRLILFFPDGLASAETRFHFEEFIRVHTERRALHGTLELIRFFVCPDCGDPIPDNYVKRLRERGRMHFDCPCGAVVLLAEPQERNQFPSRVEAMDKSADRQRDFDAFVMSAKGETTTHSFQDWAGGERVTLAIVFTDIVGSTALAESIRDEAMNEVRKTHFAQSRRLIQQLEGREIKTIGDSFMAAFRCAGSALDYARMLQSNTGHPDVRIRAGIHIGPMHVQDGDVFGGTVNFAARVVGSIPDAGIWLSDRAKDDVDRLGATSHKYLNWKAHEAIILKGFPGEFTLWALQSRS